MKFSIITPSHKQPEWLRLCAASVNAQRNVEVEHIVQDTGQTEGLEAVQEAFPHMRLYREADEGMYDAVNRGFAKAGGDILAYLNCDEQYLPGTLRKVQDAFEARPEVDILCGNFVVIDTEGRFLCFRKIVEPRYWMVAMNHALPVGTCSMFIRRSALERYGLGFDKSWKNIGDAAFVRDALRKGVRFGTLEEFTSLFTFTGENLNFHASVLPEKKRFRRESPFYFSLLKPLFVTLYRMRKMSKRCYCQTPFPYEAYTLKNPEQREAFVVAHPTHKFPAFEIHGH